MSFRTLVIAAALTLPLVACDKPTEEPVEKDQAGTEEAPAEKGAKDAHDAFANLSPGEVQKLVDEKGCTPVDANGSSTRDKYGIVPGAVLLSGSDFKTSELPEDKKTKLVFYCGGQACMAAPKAAKVAQDAGYENVNVMRAGIRGWVDAGQKVDKPTT